MSTLLGMKTNGLAFTCLWLLLGAVTIQLPAQGVLKFKPDEVKIVGGEKDSTTQFKPSAALNEAFQEEWRTKREEEWRKEFEALKTKAEGADSNAKWQLGIRYYQGRGVTKNLPEALRLFREAAEHGVNREDR